MTRRISGLSELAPDYRAILCDVWGVLHNGESVHRQAEDALMRFRDNGGSVVLLTNSPRPRTGVLEQLAAMGVHRDAFDDIVTSGDVTRELIKGADGLVFHLGPARDLPLFDGLDKTLVADGKCKYVVCTGLFEDEVETPQDYRSQLEKLAARNIPFICANPDVVVERGDRLIYCAGALARLYEELGGETLVAGKPHAPIYRVAMEKLARICAGELSKGDVLAVGDGMPTDVAGAINNSFALLYVSAGIHSHEYGPTDHPDEAALESFLHRNKVDPLAWIPRLKWDGIPQ